MKFFLIILLLLGVSVAQEFPGEIQYDGLMPVVEVVAQRYADEPHCYVGAMPEVTVTAQRYEYEDEAWSGLMPEVVVTAVRPALETIAYSKENKHGVHQDAKTPAF